MFYVTYRWRIRRDSEMQFIDAWCQATKLIRQHRGGLGSRLHRCEDNTWLAYAKWPDRKTWEKALELPSVDEHLIEKMQSCVVKRYKPVPLDPVADLLDASLSSPT